MCLSLSVSSWKNRIAKNEVHVKELGSIPRSCVRRWSNRMPKKKRDFRSHGFDRSQISSHRSDTSHQWQTKFTRGREDDVMVYQCWLEKFIRGLLLQHSFSMALKRCLIRWFRLNGGGRGHSPSRLDFEVSFWGGKWSRHFLHVNEVWFLSIKFWSSNRELLLKSFVKSVNAENYAKWVKSWINE